MKYMKIIIAITLLIGLVGISMGIMAFTFGGKAEESNSASTELFSMVVEMAGKELTIDAPRLSPVSHEGYGVVTVLVKNSGNEPIALAEIKITCWDQSPHERGWSERVQVKDLAPGEVQTIVYNAHWSWEKGSIRVKVTNIK